MKTTDIQRKEALERFLSLNKDPFHLLHALTVEGIMSWYSKELGYDEEEPYWSMVGLLHDIDFGKHPTEHLQHAPMYLRELGADGDFITSVVSHGYGICAHVEPVHPMEKVLFAADELSGIIDAARRLRPSKSTKDMDLKSLRKKFKSRSFAAGCNRDIISLGAERLEWPLDDLLLKTLTAMQSCEDRVAEEMEKLLANA